MTSLFHLVFKRYQFNRRLQFTSHSFSEPRLYKLDNRYHLLQESSLFTELLIESMVQVCNVLSFFHLSSLNPYFPESQNRFQHKPCSFYKRCDQKQRLELHIHHGKYITMKSTQRQVKATKYDVENNNGTGNSAFMSLSDNPLATVVRFISINLLRFHSLTYLNVSVIRSLFEWLVM
ncbi:hypothetical protein IGI04_009202 [Brassica rapa subsp. trilocularis]|uniref:Uncharacterized protein n=1 Tax=Brassica rapa subsp. trilocularis TaxID=1813537 RepID=A0ABQ7MWK5_BRACM|nr:hypothetical protein IGI04_009202 [Brassica rapa subsp. trilocularis]